MAFGHALKVALQSGAKLDIMHVETQLSPEKPYWIDFRAVRATLSRWGSLPEGVRQEEVVKALSPPRRAGSEMTAVPGQTLARYKYPRREIPELFFSSKRQLDQCNG